MKLFPKPLVLSLSSAAAFAPTGLTNAVQRPPLELHYFFGSDDNIIATNRSFNCNVLDLNRDGKVDYKDLVHFMDVNGDGVVDGKYGRAALSIALVFWLVTGSPAYAKGGGSGHSSGGGGHGGSYHSGSYSSEESYPAFKRPNRRLSKNKYLRPSDPKACSNLPDEEELLDVLVNKHIGTYRPGTVTTVNESRCAFTVQGDRFGTKTLHTHRNWIDWATTTTLVGIVAGAPIYSTVSSWGQELVECFGKHRDDSFDREFQLTDTPTRLPASRAYIGTTSESDGINQSIKTTIKFHDSNGTITGFGEDSADGKYTIQGTIRGNMVRWTEQYRYYSVTVRGYVTTSDYGKNDNDEKTTISCRFVSTRGVRGNFELKSCGRFISNQK